MTGRVIVPLPLANRLDSQTSYISRGILRENSTQCEKRFVDPRKQGPFFFNFNFYFPGLDMMGELCLGALKLQGRRQSFWGLQMGRDTAGLRRKTRTEEKQRKGRKSGGLGGRQKRKKRRETEGGGIERDQGESSEGKTK